MHSPKPVSLCFRSNLRVFATLAVLIAPAIAAEAPEPAKSDSAPEAKYVVVEGQITDLVGSGLSGVVIVARRKSSNHEPGSLIGQSTTDGYGDFAVRSEVPVDGIIVVTATKPSHATLVREFNLDDDEFPPYLADALGGDVAIAGRVIRFDSQAPIKGVTIQLAADDQDWTAFSDEDGRFSIQGVPPGRGTITASASGFGREQQVISHLADAGEIELELEAGRTVKLIVVDDLNQPIPGVVAECFAEEDDDFRADTTNAEGVITIEGLHIDTAELSIKLVHDEHVSDESFDRTVVLPATPNTSEHTLTMPRAGSVSGTVTDAKTKQSLNGARVSTGILDTYASPRDWSNYRGRYSVGGVRPGRTVVTVHLADYAPELMTIDVVAGKSAPLEIKLKPAAKVRGVVKDKEGKLLTNVYVDATRWRGYETLGLRTLTGEDGRFVIENAPADEFEVEISARGMKNMKRTVKAGSSDPIEITMEVDPNARPGEPAQKVKPGDPAPKFELTTLDGVKLNLEALKGKTVLIDFWATWCSPCVAQLPDVVDIYKKFGEREDFALIGVSLDYDEKTLRDFVKKRELGWHQVYGEAGGAEAAADAFGVVGIPDVFIIDAEGKIAATRLMGSQAHEIIEKMLAKPDKP